MDRDDLGATGPHFIVTVRIHEEGRYFVGSVDELGISSFGESLGEALAMTMDAVCTHLGALEAQGEARRFLEGHGVRIHPTHPLHEDVQPVAAQVRPDEVVASKILPFQDELLGAIG